MERRRRAVELHETGLSTQKVADALGCTWETARRDLESAGFQFTRTSRAAPIVERVCKRDGCGTTFRPTLAQVRKGYGLFCSRNCDHEAHRIHPKPEQRLCAREGCGERFTPLGANVAMGWGVFCSRRCSALSTDAHRRKKGMVVTCLQCEKKRWRYDSQVGEHGSFCSRECWGEYRWKHGIAISDDVVSLASGRARQTWKGRWNGHKGAEAGIEAGRESLGRPPKMTPYEQQAIYAFSAAGRSTRDIAAEVFGDARFKDRVARFLKR